MDDDFIRSNQQSQQPAESAIIFQSNIPHKSIVKYQFLKDKTGSSFTIISSSWSIL